MESRTIRYGVTAFAALLLALGGSASSLALQDPGPRGGDAGAGEKYTGLSDPLQKLFAAGQDEFMKQDQVVADGLGPRMNLDSCFGCHANPAPGGSSPRDNPQFAFFNAPPPRGVNHSTNKLPSFITDKGPTREARFKSFDYDTTGPDGGVHDLFTIAGMTGAESCSLYQPDFEKQLGLNNVIFRIPTLFQTEREEDPNCQFTPTPSDATAPSHIMETDPKIKLAMLSDIEKFAAFTRLLAPPAPSSDTPGGSESIAKGKTSFSEVGCALCHTPTLHTVKFANPQLCEKSAIPQLCDKDVNLFSDLALHQMGAKLDDGIEQGQAKHDEFRTAPLWGLGKRIFFLHDGRTEDLVKAIEEHRSPDTRSLRCRLLSFFGLPQLCGRDDGADASEANAVVEKYNKLHDTEKQDLLNFLRSL